MFASGLQLQKDKPQAAAKRPAEREALGESTRWASTQPAASAAPWKRAKTEPRDALTQPQEEKPRSVLGAWFGAASQTRPLSALARVKVEAVTSLSQDSEDDKPLARVVVGQQQQQLRDWKQQKELQRAQAHFKEKTGFATAREAARSAVKQGPSRGATAAAASSATKMQGSEDERVFQLSTKRRITVRRWKSAVLVDIREYYDDNGVSKPGKKGISLAKDQWNTLMRMARVIDEAVALVEDDSVDGHSLEHVKERVPVNEERTIAFTLSSKRRITVRNFRTAVLIDLREYYEQGSEMKPGKKGISLSKDQWRSLLETEREISEAIQEV